ncbi:hypothetical protein HAX54_000566, partial [Datura stramonium]|nr:hypothetical protein [Datura stramonium]
EIRSANKNCKGCKKVKIQKIGAGGRMSPRWLRVTELELRDSLRDTLRLFSRR